MKHIHKVLKNIEEIRKEKITVDFFYHAAKDRFKLTKISEGDIGLDKIIRDQHINRPGLALAGYTALFTFDRVQILGNTEMRYLRQLTAEARTKALKKFFSFDIPIICVTFNNKPSDEFMEMAHKKGVAVYDPLETTRFAYFINDFLMTSSPTIALTLFCRCLRCRAVFTAEAG
jgi:HPr kinase/phosphorylase